jgi:L-aminopeptidase/D-esterase-like protein
MADPGEPLGGGLGSLTDVAGIRVGHVHRASATWRTGTTVILAPPGTTGGVSVRGAAPGTRETDLLSPGNLVDHVDGICLSGGSAYGLDAASGVMAHLESRGRGFAVGGDPSWVVPIVPAAVIFDLGRAGRFGHRPDASFGSRAASRASTRPVVLGSVGAGCGARAGGLQGGVGSVSTATADGHVVSALVVVNSVGTVVDPESGRPWHVGRHRVPDVRDGRKLREALTSRPSSGPSLNTTIGVVATTAPLSKVQCQRVADVAHDGLARAIRPAHSMNDGDTIFALATGDGDPRPIRERSVDSATLNGVLAAAAESFAEACTSAVLAAMSRGGPPAYRDFLRWRNGRRPS